MMHSYQRLSRSGRALVGLGLGLCAIGLFSWIMQLTNGLEVTHMQNAFSWGLYIAAFAFFVGVAAGGMIISSSIYVFNVEKLKPFSRIASLSAFGCILAAGVMVLLDLGSIQNIFFLFLTPNLMSPLLWDVCVVTAYLIITFLSVYMQMLPEWQKDGFFLAAWTKKRPAEEVQAFSKKWSRRVALVGLPFAVLIHTVTALIFATQVSHHWWNTAVLPPDFVAMAVASGSALVLIICMFTVGKRGFAEHADAFNIMAKVVAGALVVHFFFTLIELLLNAWNGSTQGQELVHILFNEYAALYLAELIFPAIAMIMFFMRRFSYNRPALLIGSILVIVGAFAHRMMLLYPAFNEPALSLNVAGASIKPWVVPLSTGRPDLAGAFFSTSFAYVPSLLEWGVTMLPFGIALTVIAGTITFFKLISEK
ncbi:MAG: polysulfide reductase NrfD [Coriobacteriales bacterium]|nr:polysulfide reductase NrfD [Coriobacteriales bacterium]